MANLTDLAEEQWGLFTRRQAEATGMAWSTLARLAGHATLIERVTHGVYRLRGTPPTDHLELRAAWLQLSPDIPVWERIPEQGVISHRSAADLLGLGHLPADTHEFTLPSRRQSRRPDVRLHRCQLDEHEWIRHAGLLVTRPARIAADLLADHEDPAAVGYAIADALRAGQETPSATTEALARLATRFRLPPGDGVGVLAWLLDLTDVPERDQWLASITPDSITTPTPKTGS